MMTQRRPAPKSLRSRLSTLRRRHRDLEERIAAEHQRPLPDLIRLKRLKKERLGLKDAITVTRMILSRHQPDTLQTG